jgi:hypothetical protein
LSVSLRQFQAHNFGFLFHQKRAMDIPVHQDPCTDSQLRKEQQKDW